MSRRADAVAKLLEGPTNADNNRRYDCQPEELAFLGTARRNPFAATASTRDLAAVWRKWMGRE